MTMKINDPHGSWRCIVVGFDVSKADFERIRKAAKDKGLTVRAFVSESLAVKNVTVRKNQKMYESLQPYWGVVKAELERLGIGEEDYESL